MLKGGPLPREGGVGVSRPGVLGRGDRSLSPDRSCPRSRTGRCRYGPLWFRTGLTGELLRLHGLSTSPTLGTLVPPPPVFPLNWSKVLSSQPRRSEVGHVTDRRRRKLDSVRTTPVLPRRSRPSPVICRVRHRVLESPPRRGECCVWMWVGVGGNVGGWG